MSEQANKLIEGDDIRSLMEQLGPHAAKWRMIGTNLGFRREELNAIQSQQNLAAEAPTSYLEKLLSQWAEWAKGDIRGTKSDPILKDLKNTYRQSCWAGKAGCWTENRLVILHPDFNHGCEYVVRVCWDSIVYYYSAYYSCS